jgi:hypothetical protein
MRPARRADRSFAARILGSVGPTSAGLLVGVVWWVALDPSRLRRVAYSLLVAYLWTVSIASGALLWIALGHLVGARWQVALRRLAELLTVPLPWLGACAALLLLPVAFGSSLVYGWVGARMAGPELAGRAAYLSPWGFAVRGGFYLLVWNACAYYFRSRSLLQDRSARPELVRALRRASAPALVALVLTLTFAAIDWVMTLDPDWTSTIFGLYFSLGCAVAALAALVLLTVGLSATESVGQVVGSRQYHDLGRSLYTFVLLWAYVAFCQFLLVWYAELPGEMAWLGRRLTGSWKTVSVLLVLAHWAVPMFGLMPQAAKERPRVLAFWAAWLLLAHYLDLFWLVMPEVTRTGSPIHLVDVACLLGLGGGYVALIARVARRTELVPVGDPRLAAAPTVDQA